MTTFLDNLSNDLLIAFYWLFIFPDKEYLQAKLVYKEDLLFFSCLNYFSLSDLQNLACEPNPMAIYSAIIPTAVNGSSEGKHPIQL